MHLRPPLRTSSGGTAVASMQRDKSSRGPFLFLPAAYPVPVLFGVLLFLAPVGWSRTVLKDHTIEQVLVGTSLGLGLGLVIVAAKIDENAQSIRLLILNQTQQTCTHHAEPELVCILVNKYLLSFSILPFAVRVPSTTQSFFFLYFSKYAFSLGLALGQNKALPSTRCSRLPSLCTRSHRALPFLLLPQLAAYRGTSRLEFLSFSLFLSL